MPNDRWMGGILDGSRGWPKRQLPGWTESTELSLEDDRA